MKLALRILSFPYRFTANNTVKTIRDLKDSTGEEGQVTKKVYNGLSLVPVAAAIVVFLIAIISFIAKAGFVNQFDLVKSKGFGALESVWTTGTSGLFYNPWISLGAGGALVALMVIAAIELFRNAEKWKKILFTAMISLLSITGGIFAFAYVKSEEFFSLIGKLGMDSHGSARVIPVFVALGISILLAVGCAILLAGFKPFIRCFINTVFYFTIAPLTCLIIENIIGLVVFAVMLAIIGIAGLIAGHSLDTTPEDEEAMQKAAIAEKEQKERKKKLDRIAVLKAQVNEREKCIKNHYEGKFGYGTIDPEYCTRVNRSAKEEIEMIRDSLI